MLIVPVPPVAAIPDASIVAPVPAVTVTLPTDDVADIPVTEIIVPARAVTLLDYNRLHCVIWLDQ